MGTSDGTVDSHGQSHPSHGTVGLDGQWDMEPLSRDSGLPWTVPPVPWYSGIGRTVGYGAPKQGQCTPMDSPICPMVQ